MPDNDKNKLKNERVKSGRQCTDPEDRRKRRESLLRRYTRGFVILDAAIRDISKADTPVKTAVDIVLKAGDFNSIVLYLVDEKTGKPGISCHTEVKGSLRGLLDNDILTDKIITKVMETGHIVASLETEAVEPLVGIPLKSEDRVIGIVLGVCRSNRKISTEDKHLLETLGCQIGVAIHNTQLLDKMDDVAFVDNLTGLYNRRYLEDALETEIYRSLRYGDSFSLVMMNVDGFKAFADRFGRQSGNNALRALARTLKSELRKTDVACQCGRDEFGIVLPATDAQQAQKVVDRIRMAFLEMADIRSIDEQLPFDFKSGIAQFPQAAVTARDMMYLADSALYCARINGKNKSVLISDLATVPKSQNDREAQQVYSLVQYVERRELFTLGHAKNVSIISGLLGKAIGLSVKDLNKLNTAAFLHDIGKSRVPASLLTKPDKLTGDELEIMKNHSLEGARLVARAAEFKGLVPIVKHHHEKYDGTGYPTGLKGEKIPLLSRIICIADAFDTMIRHRSYSMARSFEDALNEICACSGTQFDPVLVDVLVDISDSLREKCDFRRDFFERN